MREDLDQIRSKNGLSVPVIVRGELSLADCAALMKERGVTCILVSESPGTLEGIFTDKDLFLKLNQKNNSLTWNSPVRTVMSKPVVSLPYELIHMAPELMISKHIQHVPIMAKTKDGETIPLGMLTMDSLFRVGISHSHSWRTFHQKSDEGIHIGILSNDPIFRAGLAEMMKSFATVTLRRILGSEIVRSESLPLLVSSFTDFIIDVDGQSAKQLARLFLALKHQPSVRNVWLIHSPAIADPTIAAMLLSLQSCERFVVLQKPMDAAQMLAVLAERQGT